MSLYTINNLKTSIKKGGARPDKYKVEIKIPLLLRSLPFIKKVKVSDDYLSVMANAVTLPGRTLSTIKAFHRGHAFNVRGATEFSGTFDITFYNTPDMDIYELFSNWMYYTDAQDGLIDSIFIGNYIGIKSNGLGYMTDFYITQYSNSGSEGAKYKICYVYPVSIKDTDFSASDTNKISTVTVTFAFTQVERV